MPDGVVVFAYHNVGVVGIKALLRAGVEIKLVLTHQDNPDENIWFDSVAELARAQDIPCITPDDPNQRQVLERISDARALWLFSFYYRHMLSRQVLSLFPCGAFNLHGSLLPKYRGRAPVNWAVLKGETETGVSLHQMVEKPDAGALVDQQAIAILPNDTAHDVFLKLTPAAEKMLDRCLPRLLSGDIELKPLDLAQGSYFSGRKAEDGRIDWSQSTWQIHNLIRAVAPPYPGAFFTHQDKTVFILASSYYQEPAAIQGQALSKSVIYWQDGQLYADCIDGKRFRIDALNVDGKSLDRKAFAELFAGDRIYP